MAQRHSTLPVVYGVDGVPAVNDIGLVRRNLSATNLVGARLDRFEDGPIHGTQNLVITRVDGTKLALNITLNHAIEFRENEGSKILRDTTGQYRDLSDAANNAFARKQFGVETYRMFCDPEDMGVPAGNVGIQGVPGAGNVGIQGVPRAGNVGLQDVPRDGAATSGAPVHRRRMNVAHQMAHPYALPRQAVRAEIGIARQVGVARPHDALPNGCWIAVRPVTDRRAIPLQQRTMPFNAGSTIAPVMHRAAANSNDHEFIQHMDEPHQAERDTRANAQNGSTHEVVGLAAPHRHQNGSTIENARRLSEADLVSNASRSESNEMAVEDVVAQPFVSERDIIRGNDASFERIDPESDGDSNSPAGDTEEGAPSGHWHVDDESE